MSIVGTYIMPHAPILIEAIGNNQTSEAIKTVEKMKQISAEIATLNPDTIVIISPHGPIFNDAIAIYALDEYKGDFDLFGRKDLKIQIEKDEQFIKALLEENDSLEGVFYPLVDEEFRMFQYKPELDHGVLVPTYFLQQSGVETKYVCMSYGTLPYSELLQHGQLIQKTAQKLNQRTVIIASGDLSHALSDCGPCQYHASGEVFDHFFIETLQNQDPYAIFQMDNAVINEAEECGLRSYAIALGAYISLPIKSEVFSYEAPFGVGYLTAKLESEGEQNRHGYENYIKAEKKQITDRVKKEHFFAKLAREVICYYLKNQKEPEIKISTDQIQVGDVFLRLPFDVYPDDFNELKASFVSIKFKGTLRGCMGHIDPSAKTFIKGLVANAINAAFYDERFSELTLEELEDTLIEVEALSPLETIEDIQLLNPIKYGICVRCGDQMGVLLPHIEGIHTVEEQLRIASNKGGFSMAAIEKIERFTVQHYC